MTKLPCYLRLPAKAPAVAGVEHEEKREWEKKEERELIPAIRLLQGMTLTEFRKSGLVVVVRCAVLGDEVVWAADGTETSFGGFDGQGRVVYRGEELRLLALLGPQEQVAYHALRKGAGEVEVESVGLTQPDQVEPRPVAKKQRGAA